MEPYRPVRKPRDLLIERAQESLRAAELCLGERLANSAASRAYYAMFQAAHVALEAAGVGRAQWSHPALQAAFTTELIYRRRLYPNTLRAHLSIGLGVRHIADYGAAWSGWRQLGGGQSHGSTGSCLRLGGRGGYQAWPQEVARGSGALFSTQS
jgi:uncharacterized protein (UPF0332 family)